MSRNQVSRHDHGVAIPTWLGFRKDDRHRVGDILRKRGRETRKSPTAAARAWWRMTRSEVFQSASSGMALKPKTTLANRRLLAILPLSGAEYFGHASTSRAARARLRLSPITANLLCEGWSAALEGCISVFIFYLLPWATPPLKRLMSLWPAATCADTPSNVGERGSGDPAAHSTPANLVRCRSALRAQWGRSRQKVAQLRVVVLTIRNEGARPSRALVSTTSPRRVAPSTRNGRHRIRQALTAPTDRHRHSSQELLNLSVADTTPGASFCHSLACLQ